MFSHVINLCLPFSFLKNSDFTPMRLLADAIAWYDNFCEIAFPIIIVLFLKLVMKVLAHFSTFYSHLWASIQKSITNGGYWLTAILTCALNAIDLSKLPLSLMEQEVNVIWIYCTKTIIDQHNLFTWHENSEALGSKLIFWELNTHCLKECSEI